MPEDFTTLIDAPVTLADGATTSRIQVAQLGDFKDPRYGRFSITRKMVDSWKALLSDYFQGGVPIDYDHATDKGGSSEAAAWIKSIALDGERVMADVEWTPEGAQAVRDKRWLFISPTFVGDFKDQQGRSLGPALLRAALTNSPFLRSMPAISLSAAPLFAQPDPRADSRPPMPDIDTTKLLEALGVDEPDEAKLLEAVEKLKADAAAKSDPPAAPDLKTLAADAGKVLLDAAQLAELQQNASEGAAAAAKLREQTFTLAYDKAMTEGRVDAKDETRELHRGIYDVDAERSLKLLASLPKVVNTAPRGTGGGAPDVDVPDGADAERFELDARAKAYMLEHKTDDYLAAAQAVSREA